MRSTMKALVNHRSAARVFEFESVLDLVQKVRAFFGLQGGEWDLEIYDDDWSSWVLLNEEDAITGARPRIRTVMRGDLVVLESTGTTSTSSVVVSQLDTPEPPTSPELRRSGEDAEIRPKSGSDALAESQQTAGVSRMDTMEVLDAMEVIRFDDSQLRPGLLEKLRSKKPGSPLTRTEWSEVTTVIVTFEKACNSVLNLTHARYMELADRALVQWPALHFGCSPKQALSQVKAKIQWRVRNEKRRDDGSDAELQASSKRLSRGKTFKGSRYEGFEGYKEYLPPMPEEDVQHLRNRLLKHLHEANLTSEGKAEREALINSTFADRRRHVVTLRTSMRKLLELYPILRNPDEIWRELAKLEGETESSKLGDYRRRLSDFLTAIQLITECQDTDCVESLLYYLDANPEDIFEGSGSAPHYQVNDDGSIGLFVEGVCLTRSVDRSSKADLLLLWAAIFPVFNQKCPVSKAKNALIFITVNIFEKGGNQTLSNRVLGRVQRLKQLCA
ncbi:uncharacterized protein LOC122394192 isoform X1 [Amphibalanus amphitrite]|uniref:uncharacterized protein LOC122364835 isoform X1 n=2 Tax=Amphibalanus amphitrite TaxID=1232801 RepID=UPI001C904416|nr:uncharacterized protein LOC122364835 isoform X1 [Amphibalanus amphitrite]XP_043212393.1 uncharacterized protein LOC122376559 isoform X1 [Amphibalanus amphitrite]XP_043246845.1 uncharacterized protein LOC122394192 isoform X1 [Amphibalanus amphitrite]